jgi:hypothetical protein
MEIEAAIFVSTMVKIELHLATIFLIKTVQKRVAGDGTIYFLRFDFMLSSCGKPTSLLNYYYNGN